jgi:hypothetical protein
MEITYGDSEGNETRITPVRVERDPFAYYIPSTFSFLETTVTLDVETDVFEYAEGGHLLVERIVVNLEDDMDIDGFLFLKDRAAGIPGCNVNPVTLVSGFSMLSFSEPSQEWDDHVDLSCELCAVRDRRLCSISFVATVQKDAVDEPIVFFNARTIKSFARMTNWIDRPAGE